MEQHFLNFPYGEVVFGKQISQPCHVVFQYASYNDGGYKLSILSLTSTDERGRVTDSMQLLEDHGDVIKLGIIGNQSNWDLDELWW